MLRPNWTSEDAPLFWTPDSKRLIVVEAIDAGAQAEARITTIEVPKLTTRIVATLHAKDSEAISRPLTESQFEPFAVSQDGQYLFMKVNEIGSKQDGYFINLDSLRAVKLQDGAVSTLSQFEKVSGFDWHDETPTSSARKAGEPQPMAP